MAHGLEHGLRSRLTWLRRNWSRLHRGDQEPLPTDQTALHAWQAYHDGDFEKAVRLGLTNGTSGANAANRAACIHARYLEHSERHRHQAYLDVSQRCESLQKTASKDANVWYLHALALGRYSQSISVTEALAQGMGNRIRNSLERALALQPLHADAHIASGAFHAEILHKVGALVGRLKWGVSRAQATEHFETALRLNPDSAIARIEYANALVLLDGHKSMAQAQRLYHEATQCAPMDAMERLDVALAHREAAAF